MGVADAPANTKPVSRIPQPPERWRVQGGDTATRLDSWSEILAATHLAFDVRPTRRTPSRFQGAVTRRAIGDLMLVDCAASPFLGSRNNAVIAAQDQPRHDNVLGFSVRLQGRGAGREGDRELALKPGDVVLWTGCSRPKSRSSTRSTNVRCCSRAIACWRCVRGWLHSTRRRRCRAAAPPVCSFAT